MAKLSELFGAGSPDRSLLGSVQTARPQPAISPEGAPPGNQRYGPEKALTDRYAGKTLSDLLRDMAGQVDLEAVTKSMRPEDGGKIWTAQILKDKIFMQPKGQGQQGQGAMNPDNLIILPTAEAQAILSGQGQPSLLGQQQPTLPTPPAMPGVGGGGRRLGPPGFPA